MTILIEIILPLVALIVLLDFFTGFRMSKSLLNRLVKRADDAAESVRDPVADAHVALMNIKSKRDEMVNLRKELLLEVKKAKAKETKSAADVAKFEQLAVLAGQSGNVDDVKLALEKKANADKAMNMAQGDIARLSKQEDALEEKISEFDGLIEKAENDKTYLESSLKINKFNTEVNNVLKDNNGSASNAIQRLRDDVEKSAMEAELSGELAEGEKSLESKYAPVTGVTEDDIAKYLKK